MPCPVNFVFYRAQHNVVLFQIIQFILTISVINLISFIKEPGILLMSLLTGITLKLKESLTRSKKKYLMLQTIVTLLEALHYFAGRMKKLGLMTSELLIRIMVMSY